MNRRSQRTQIPEHRRTVYYVGAGLMVLGLLLFLSTFVTACSSFGDFSNFESRSQSQFGTALAGMALLVVGGLLRQIGSRGLAGSGVVLDPEQARKDIEPWSRMTGGAVKDALDEAGVKLPGGAAAEIKVRCMACKALNDEHDRFCGQCGKPLA